jgi:hypothetical protein
MPSIATSTQEPAMNRFLLFPALAVTFAASLAAQAQPLRHDIVRECPQLAQALPDLLASAKQQDGRDGLVRAELRIDERGRVQVERLEGSRAYVSSVRRALSGIECGSPKAVAQRQVLNIRFEDPAPAAQQPTQFAAHR